MLSGATAAKVYTENAWQKQLERIPAARKDVFFQPDYFAQFAARERGVAEAFIVETEDNIALMPYFKRRLGDLIPYTKFANHYDISSAYGFGGVLFKKFEKCLVKRFFAAFHEYCVANNIVTSFSRIHPLLNDEPTAYYPNAREINQSVFVDVCKSIDDLAKEFKHSARKSIRKAREAGVVVKRDDSIPLEAFCRVYGETMARNRAESFYMFDESFFQSLASRLNGQFTTYIAYLDDVPVSVEIVLQSQCYWHSYLGGTLAEYMKSCANSLLKYCIIEDAVNSQARYFLLGGGRVGGDQIFKYKSTFAPRSTVPFYIDCSVHDEEVYDALLKEWEENNPEEVGKVGLFQRYAVV